MSLPQISAQKKHTKKSSDSVWAIMKYIVVAEKKKILRQNIYVHKYSNKYCT